MLRAERTAGEPASPFVPPMPPVADDRIGGLRVLLRLQRNGFSAFPPRCLREGVVRLGMPGRALVLAASPQAVQLILQTEASNFRRLAAGRRILGPIVGRGLLVSEGETWRRQRRAMAPAFTPRTVPVLATHIMRCAEASCRRLKARRGEPVDLLAEMQRLALEVAAVSMFSLEADGFGGALRAMVSGYMATIGRPTPSDFLLPDGMPTPLGWRRARFRRRWSRLIADIVAARRALPLAGEETRDLYDMMAAAYGAEGLADDALLADEVATMIVAGHETTALVLFWSCLLLAQVPTWQERIAAEARDIDLSPHGAAASLPLLPVTCAVVQEALRLYPPAFMTAREAIAPTNVCGVAVPARSVVLMPFFLLHRDPRSFERPEAFDPGRFLDRPPPDRYAYLPFGVGPNVCIGSSLAMSEAVLVLARLIRDNRLAVDGTRAVLPVGVLSTRPDISPAFTLHPR